MNITRRVILAIISLVVCGVSYGATPAEIEAHRANRGLVDLNNPFVSKGTWIVGATGAYSTHDNDNYNFTFVEGINSEGYTLTASPMVAYTFKNNLAAGLRFEYGRSMLDIDDAMLSIGSGDDSVEVTVNEFYALQHSYTLMGILRQYIPLGNAKRFALFSEMRLEGGGFTSKFAHDVPVKGTFSEGYYFGASVVPGLIAFATNSVAFEVMVGVMGVNYSHADQVHNQVYVGEVDNSNMSFKVNLLSISLGVSIYL